MNYNDNKIESKSKSTRKRVLEVAKNEFLEHGFLGASLRTIAEKANVTTGALYGLFADKKAIFNYLVFEAADKLSEMYKRSHEEFNSLSPNDQLETMFKFTNNLVDCFVDYIYDNFDRFKLIVCRANGSGYENYIDKLIHIKTESIDKFIKVLNDNGYAINDIRADLNHILVSSYFNGFFEVVAHDMKKEDAKQYISLLVDFFNSGWEKLLSVKK